MDRIDLRTKCLVIAFSIMLSSLLTASVPGEETDYDSSYTAQDEFYDGSDDSVYEEDYDSYTDYGDNADPSETEVEPAAPEQQPSAPAPNASDTAQTDLVEGWPEGPYIESGSAVVLECETGALLYAKDPYASLDPGSTVKILTVLLALENADMQDEVTITETGLAGVTDGGLNISAQLGETFTIEQCLYAIMLASANEITIQVAEHLGGTVENFVRMMNTRAAELGCVNSNFTNPTGLEDPLQLSCAHDMALIMETALKNSKFLSIAKTSTYTIPATNMSGGDRVLTNSFSMLSSSSGDYYADCLGGKQGFTETSGTTLLCAAQRDDVTLVCSILQGSADMVYQDATYLLDYGFENFYLTDLSEDDFDILTGGTVVLPYGQTPDALTFESEPSGEEVNRTYYFNGIVVGKAQAQVTKSEENLDVAKGDQYLEEARVFSENKSSIPYGLIAAAGILVIALLIRMLIRTVKSE